MTKDQSDSDKTDFEIKLFDSNLVYTLFFIAICYGQNVQGKVNGAVLRNHLRAVLTCA